MFDIQLVAAARMTAELLDHIVAGLSAETAVFDLSTDYLFDLPGSVAELSLVVESRTLDLGSVVAGVVSLQRLAAVQERRLEPRELYALRLRYRPVISLGSDLRQAARHAVADLQS